MTAPGAGLTAKQRIVPMIQGECRVSDEADVVLTTLLGSCVSVCLCDPVAAVGGMNHFLLPGGREARSGGERYGVNAMEVLINGLLKLGGRRARFEAKLFGGAALGDGMGRIGAENARFALDFLETERIPCISSSLGGLRPRRIRYVPTTGLASQSFVRDAAAVAMPLAPPVSGGDVDLFEGGG